MTRGEQIKQATARLRTKQLGKLEHLLALSAKYPNLQEQFPIAGLGSLRVDQYNNRSLPFLNRQHSLAVRYFDSDWEDHWRFLVVRKLPEKKTQ